MTCCVSVLAGMFWLIIGSCQNLPQHKKSEQRPVRSISVISLAVVVWRSSVISRVISRAIEISDGGSGSITLLQHAVHFSKVLTGR
jgi:hypothetical protein